MIHGAKLGYNYAKGAGDRIAEIRANSRLGKAVEDAASRRTMNPGDFLDRVDTDLAEMQGPTHGQYRPIDAGGRSMALLGATINREAQGGADLFNFPVRRQHGDRDEGVPSQAMRIGGAVKEGFNVTNQRTADELIDLLERKRKHDQDRAHAKANNVEPVNPAMEANVDSAIANINEYINMNQTIEGRPVKGSSLEAKLLGVIDTLRSTKRFLLNPDHMELVEDLGGGKLSLPPDHVLQRHGATMKAVREMQEEAAAIAARIEDLMEQAGEDAAAGLPEDGLRDVPIEGFTSAFDKTGTSASYVDYPKGKRRGPGTTTIRRIEEALDREKAKLDEANEKLRKFIAGEAYEYRSMEEPRPDVDNLYDQGFHAAVGAKPRFPTEHDGIDPDELREQLKQIKKSNDKAHRSFNRLEKDLRDPEKGPRMIEEDGDRIQEEARARFQAEGPVGGAVDASGGEPISARASNRADVEAARRANAMDPPPDPLDEAAAAMDEPDNPLRAELAEVERTIEATKPRRRGEKASTEYFAAYRRRQEILEELENPLGDGGAADAAPAADPTEDAIRAAVPTTGKTDINVHLKRLREGESDAYVHGTDKQLDGRSRNRYSAKGAAATWDAGFAIGMRRLKGWEARLDGEPRPEDPIEAQGWDEADQGWEIGGSPGSPRSGREGKGVRIGSSGSRYFGENAEVVRRAEAAGIEIDDLSRAKAEVDEASKRESSIPGNTIERYEAAVDTFRAKARLRDLEEGPGAGLEQLRARINSVRGQEYTAKAEDHFQEENAERAGLHDVMNGGSADPKAQAEFPETYERGRRYGEALLDLEAELDFEASRVPWKVEEPADPVDGSPDPVDEPQDPLDAAAAAMASRDHPAPDVQGSPPAETLESKLAAIRMGGPADPSPKWIGQYKKGGQAFTDGKPEEPPYKDAKANAAWLIGYRTNKTIAEHPDVTKEGTPLDAAALALAERDQSPLANRMPFVDPRSGQEIELARMDEIASLKSIIAERQGGMKRNAELAEKGDKDAIKRLKKDQKWLDDLHERLREAGYTRFVKMHPKVYSGAMTAMGGARDSQIYMDRLKALKLSPETADEADELLRKIREQLVMMEKNYYRYPQMDEDFHGFVKQAREATAEGGVGYPDPNEPKMDFGDPLDQAASAMERGSFVPYRDAFPEDRLDAAARAMNGEEPAPPREEGPAEGPEPELTDEERQRKGLADLGAFLIWNKYGAAGVKAGRFETGPSEAVAAENAYRRVIMDGGDPEAANAAAERAAFAARVGFPKEVIENPEFQKRHEEADGAFRKAEEMGPAGDGWWRLKLQELDATAEMAALGGRKVSEFLEGSKQGLLEGGVPKRHDNPSMSPEDAMKLGLIDGSNKAGENLPKVSGKGSGLARRAYRNGYKLGENLPHRIERAKIDEAVATAKENAPEMNPGDLAAARKQVINASPDADNLDYWMKNPTEAMAMVSVKTGEMQTALHFVEKTLEDIRHQGHSGNRRDMQASVNRVAAVMAGGGKDVEGLRALSEAASQRLARAGGKPGEPWTRPVEYEASVRAKMDLLDAEEGVGTAHAKIAKIFEGANTNPDDEASVAIWDVLGGKKPRPEKIKGDAEGRTQKERRANYRKMHAQASVALKIRDDYPPAPDSPPAEAPPAESAPPAEAPPAEAPPAADREPYLHERARTLMDEMLDNDYLKVEDKLHSYKGNPANFAKKPDKTGNPYRKGTYENERFAEGHKWGRSAVDLVKSDIEYRKRDIDAATKDLKAARAAAAKLEADGAASEAGSELEAMRGEVARLEGEASRLHQESLKWAVGEIEKRGVAKYVGHEVGAMDDGSRVVQKQIASLRDIQNLVLDLGDTIQTLKDQGKRPRRPMVQAWVDLREILGQVSPELDAALRVGAVGHQRKEAAIAGVDVAKGDGGQSRDTIRRFRDMAPQEGRPEDFRPFFRHAYANEKFRQLENLPADANAAAGLSSAKSRAEIQGMAPGSDRLERILDAENQMFNTGRDVAAGSPRYSDEFGQVYAGAQASRAAEFFWRSRIGLGVANAMLAARDFRVNPDANDLVSDALLDASGEARLLRKAYKEFMDERKQSEILSDVVRQLLVPTTGPAHPQQIWEGD